MGARTKPPRVVSWVFEAVSAHLGRSANIRADKTGRYWFVNDPTFSYLQVGLKGGVTDYRAGFMVETDPVAISFRTVHTPTIARVFRENVSFDVLLQALDQTHQFRHANLLFYSSRRLAKAGGNIARIEATKYRTFRTQLLAHHEQANLVKDLFPVLQNRGKGPGKARKAGHDFFLLLADKATLLSRKARVAAVVDAAWPLFQCLYPKESPRRRNAILAAKLRTAGVLQVCEFSQIQRRTIFNIDSACAGRIEGAHIKPDALGGSDEPSNGLWLCQRHHRATEGLLKGKRGNVHAIST